MPFVTTLKQKNVAFASGLRRTAMSLAGNRSGNFSLLFAMLIVPLLLAIGASFDFVRAYNVQDKMQDDLDSALLSAVGEVGTTDPTSLKNKIVKVFNAQTNLQGKYKLSASDIAIDTTTSGIVATVTSTVDTTFMVLAGIDTVPIGATSAVKGGADESKSSVSMYLVVDRSGSMGENTTTQYTGTCRSKGKDYACTKYFTKIESLKMAAGDLLTQLNKADPAAEYVRTGAVSYNDVMQTPTPLAWGTAAVKTYVDALSATGGTDSYLAFRKAYESLVASSENTAHLAKNGQVPDKFIVFLTDGDNNTTSADTNTKTWCDKARLAKITVYSVAFMAPARGQALLKYCATDASHYFAAEDTAELVAAFTRIGKTASKRLVRLTN
jgi:Flp pilus assembly protein TadG/uncharacterized protein YegL